MSNAIAIKSDEWAFWREQLAGGSPETTPGTPHSGFFRDRKDRAIAIWREGDTWLCAVSRGYCPKHKDEIDDLFGFVCRRPITRELFMHIRGGGLWPEQVPAPARGIGDNNPPEALTPDKALAAEIAALETQCRKWLSGLPGGKPSNKIEADLAANYAERFLSFEKRAIDAHKTEKEPFLQAGREVDAKWFGPVRDVAKTLKEKIKAIALQWARAEDLRLAEEARKANEAARAAAEAAHREEIAKADICGEAPPPPPVIEEIVAPKTKIGTGRVISSTARIVHHIEDLPVVAAFFATMPTPSNDLRDVLQKLVNAACKAGISVPGVKTVKE